MCVSVPKRIRTEVPLLTSPTPYRSAKPRGRTHPSETYWVRLTGETDGLKQGEIQRTQPCRYSRVTVPCDLWPFLHVSPNGERSLDGGCSALKKMFNTAICMWNGQVETDVLSRFNCTAVLTRNSFEIRLGRSSLTVQLKWLLY